MITSRSVSRKEMRKLSIKRRGNEKYELSGEGRQRRYRLKGGRSVGSEGLNMDMSGAKKSAIDEVRSESMYDFYRNDDVKVTGFKDNLIKTLQDNILFYRVVDSQEGDKVEVGDYSIDILSKNANRIENYSREYVINFFARNEDTGDEKYLKMDYPYNSWDSIEPEISLRTLREIDDSELDAVGSGIVRSEVDYSERVNEMIDAFSKEDASKFVEAIEKGSELDIYGSVYFTGESFANGDDTILKVHNRRLEEDFYVSIPLRRNVFDGGFDDVENSIRNMKEVNVKKRVLDYLEDTYHDVYIDEDSWGNEVSSWD